MPYTGCISLTARQQFCCLNGIMMKPNGVVNNCLMVNTR